MIKRIIFDQDNTLMKWIDEYDDTYKEALDELGVKYTEDELKGVINIINSGKKLSYHHMK